MRHLYWSGGFDSTFRLCQIAVNYEETVQPIYVKGWRRFGEKNEIEAMAAIREYLAQEKPEVFSRVLPTRFTSYQECYEENKSKGMPDTPFRHGQIGKRKRSMQYPILGLIAYHSGVYTEIGIERSELVHGQEEDANPILSALDPFLEPFQDSVRVREALPEEGNLIQHFRGMTFPILSLTRGDMVKIARKGGYLDVLLKTWTCFRPVGSDKDQPCGKCKACVSRRSELGDLFGLKEEAASGPA